jgi:sugar phosphate isomerase/epimerase
MLSFSTCWNSDRHKNGAEMLEEILELGFNRVELGHGIRISLIEGVQKVFDSGRVTFSSLHNFCPLPIEITRSSPDCYKFSSPNDAERERALKFTFQTIDFAARLGAPNVVLHLGLVPMEPITDQLVAMAEEGEHLSRAYVKAKIKAVQHRESRAPRFLQRAKDCLSKIVEHAAEKNVRLGIESRQGFEEIPSESEMIALLEEFDPPTVGYWHDFGHVQVKHNLGFLDHHEWLQKVSPRLLGCHLHDTQWPGRDHCVPFTGQVDYDRLIPLLPPDTLFVWEMSPRRKREEIIAGLARWQERFGG